MMKNFASRMNALNAKGIKSPKTYRLLISRANDILRLANLTGTLSDMGKVQLDKLSSQIDNILLLLETKPAKSVAIVDGERMLSADQMERRITSYRYQLVIRREYQADYERRSHEQDVKLAAILAGIPVAQRNQFQDLLERMEITTNPPTKDESENLIEVEESVNA